MSIITDAKATRRLAALLVMIMGLAMILPSNLAIASTEDDGSTDDSSEVQDDDSTDEGTTEDDGYIIGDDDSQGEVSGQEELEETYDNTQWEDDVNNNDFEQAQQNDEEQITCPDGTVVSSGDYCPDVTTCSDGSVATTGQECPPQPQQTVDVPTALVPEPTYLPYCDEVSNEGCYDRKDIDQVTGLYPCNDGTQTADYKDCSDVTKNSDNSKNLPRCAYEVVRDCIVNDLGQTCLVGTIEDVCQDVFYGWDVNGDGTINSKDKDACEQPQIVVCNDGKPSTNVAPPQTPAASCPNGPDGDAPAGTCVLEYTDGWLPLVIREDNDKNNGGSSSSSSSSSSSKTTIINPTASASTSATANAAEVSSCRLDGSTNGIQQMFDTAKYQACGLYPTGQKAYSDGFVVGCTQIGNTQQLCQAFVVMNTQQTQPLATSTQAIQPAAVS